jgi:alkyl hydroperoxide reductase subunit AhpC
MVELGELEEHYADFRERNTQVMVASLEDIKKAAKTQEEFPHLIVVADADRRLAKAADVIHKGSAPDGGDTAAPTTFPIDRTGKVRWVFRPDRYIRRLSPQELLDAVDTHLPTH